ncbi:prepilin peptidase [Cohnella soli]|uniref:Prepilin peptidase n=1 Tax=Cohnella soli TaxID=425005 RepID=A0ABW0HMH4_9BACL
MYSVSTFFHTWEWIVGIPFAALIVAASFLDIRTREIPDILILPGIAYFTLVRIWIHPDSYSSHLIAGLVAGGLFYLIAVLVPKKGDKYEVGGGDIKFLALTGIVLGVKLTILSLALLSLIGTFAAIVFLIVRRRDGIIPFGPFIAGAALISYYFGYEFFRWSLTHIVV